MIRLDMEDFSLLLMLMANLPKQGTLLKEGISVKNWICSHLMNVIEKLPSLDRSINGRSHQKAKHTMCRKNFLRCYAEIVFRRLPPMPGISLYLQRYLDYVRLKKSGGDTPYRQGYDSILPKFLIQKPKSLCAGLLG
ncbi:hypothetical protein MKX03_037467 [Papaver bracteatum]|nr:hypothetical protein MKX03_037467 [Papaver bracteatum]